MWRGWLRRWLGIEGEGAVCQDMPQFSEPLLATTRHCGIVQIEERTVLPWRALMRNRWWLPVLFISLIPSAAVAQRADSAGVLATPVNLSSLSRSPISESQHADSIPAMALPRPAPVWADDQLSAAAILIEERARPWWVIPVVGGLVGGAAGAYHSYRACQKDVCHVPFALAMPGAVVGSVVGLGLEFLVRATER